MRHLAKVAPPAPPAGNTAPWWPVFRDLRDARLAYGLKPRHLTCLAALLTFLREGDGEMVVFASNRSILERLNGLCERTFQRQIGELIEAGLLRRNDSSNGKRFRIRGPADQTLSYGFDLSPLMERAIEIAAAARAENERAKHMAMLRQQILKLLANPGIIDPAREAELRLSLRRNLPVTMLKHILSDLQAIAMSQDTIASEPAECAEKTKEMSVSNSHFVGQYHKSNENYIDIDPGSECSRPSQPTSSPSLEKLRNTCPTACGWLSKGLSSWREVIGQMQQLASWVGISSQTYSKAEHQNGPESTAATLLAIIERAEGIKHPAAYFYAVTLGKRAKSFHPDRLINQLVPS